MTVTQLTTKNHDRDSAGFRYVYPVVSRRAKGVSIGVNLNPNNACNWQCVYCQVPGLIRGVAPTIDLELLDRELRTMLQDVVHGDFMEQSVPEGMRRLNDIALSGNGESTTSGQFEDVMATLADAMQSFDLVGSCRVVLITNGSMIHQDVVRAGLAAMAKLGGEIWFKFDAGTADDRQAINGVGLEQSRIDTNLKLALQSGCRVRIQSCFVAIDGKAPSPQFVANWLSHLERWVGEALAISDVMVYGMARESHQPDRDRLKQLPLEWLQKLADQVQAIGLRCSVSH